MRGIRSVGLRHVSSVIFLILKSNNSFFAFVKAILKEPNCSFKSPTYQSVVPFSNPRQTTQWSVEVLIYSKIGVSNLLLCLLISRKGFILSSLVITWRTSSVANISTRISDVIVADLYHLTRVGMVLPQNL